MLKWQLSSVIAVNANLSLFLTYEWHQMKGKRATTYEPVKSRNVVFCLCLSCNFCMFQIQYDLMKMKMLCVSSLSTSGSEVWKMSQKLFFIFLNKNVFFKIFYINKNTMSSFMSMYGLFEFILVRKMYGMIKLTGNSFVTIVQTVQIVVHRQWYFKCN